MGGRGFLLGPHGQAHEARGSGASGDGLTLRDSKNCFSFDSSGLLY